MVLFLATMALLFQIYFWGARLWEIAQAGRTVPEIDPEQQSQLPSEAPLISVIVPAFNEQDGIGACLRSVLAQDYPNFELIFVNDRSNDNTLAIAESLIRNKTDAILLTVKDLPAGWTGKCHALNTAAQRASGEWLAFLDADTRLHKSALRQCYCEAVRRKVSMLTLSPRFVLKTFWEKALQPAFAAMSCILFPLSLVNDPDSKVASANGMFYIINRQAYDRIGGHRDVKGLAVEDIGIGKRVKAAGLGLLFANGRSIMRTRMYTDFHETVSGWIRILSASMNYELMPTIKYLCMHILVSFPILVTALHVYFWNSSGLIAELFLPGICIFGMTVASCLFCSQIGAPKKYSVLLVIGNLALIWVYLIILKRILLNEPLQWRGTTYRLNRYSPAALDPTTSETGYSEKGIRAA